MQEQHDLLNEMAGRKKDTDLAELSVAWESTSEENKQKFSQQLISGGGQ